MAARDEYTDSSRTGPGKSRESCMMDIDFDKWGTLADEKLADPNSIGTASDYAGVTDKARRRR